MLSSYFKIAFRTFWVNRTLGLVNVIGLAIGLAVTLLIVLYVAHEYSYDRFHSRGRQIMKVEFRQGQGDQTFTVPWMSYRFGEAVKNACPGVDDFARLTERTVGSKLVQSDPQHKAFETGFKFADPGFLRMFSFRLLKGDPKTVLTRPATVVLTERMARKYFGTADPLGKSVTYDKQHRLQVVGIIQDPPVNSSIQFDFLGDIFTHQAIQHDWHAGFLGEKKADEIQESVGTGGNYETYFLLHPQASPVDIERKIPSLLTKDDRITEAGALYKLHPLFGFHFDVGAPGSQRRATIFSVIGGLILILALVNYVSLTTARSTIRAKEVGVRKVVGAARRSLIGQFYFESMLYVTLAFGVAALFFMVLQPLFFETIHLTIDPSFLTSPFFLLPAAGFYLLSILLSGSYPALLLSRFAPIKVLKGRFSAVGSARWVRQGLTVFQFTVSVALIIGSVVIYRQLSFLLEKDLGVVRDRIVVFHVDPEDGLDKHYRAIRRELRQLKEVDAVTGSSLIMYDYYMNSWHLKSEISGQEADINTFEVDETFLKTLGIRWAVPPRPGEDRGSQGRLVLNETAAKQLGIHAGNYEQTFDLGHGPRKRLIGIVKDFNYTSLARKIKPVALSFTSDTTAHFYLYVKLARGIPTPTALTAIQRVYDRYKTEKPFAYTFLDETYRRLYESELSLSKIILAFTGFAILLASLGLFGLAAFTAEQRTKEIGIRKVLGASVVSLVRLLSADYLKLVLVAIVLASPIAGIVMNRWLQDFAYRIDVAWWVFAVAALLAVGIAFLTVSFQSVRAALMNPVKSLRSE